MKPADAVFAIALVVAAVSSISSQSTVPIPQASGAMVNGLRIGISTVGSGKLPSVGAEFWVALENTGDSDFVVNLGSMLGNGKVMFPDAIRLILTDPAGRTRELQYFDRKHAVVGARLDDFTVALRSGSVYALRLSLDQYSHPATSNIELNLAEGRHRIAARFDGQGARLAPGDMRGVSLLNFWSGIAESNAVEFEVSKRAAER